MRLLLLKSEAVLAGFLPKKPLAGKLKANRFSSTKLSYYIVFVGV